jgi:hypothetical protein
MFFSLSLFYIKTTCHQRGSFLFFTSSFFLTPHSLDDVALRVDHFDLQRHLAYRMG